MKKPQVSSVKANSTSGSCRCTQRKPDLRHVQRAGHRIQQRNPGQHHERRDRVRHREIERSLQRRRLPRLQAAQRKCRRAHQLEEHEQVEQIAGQRKAAHGRQEDQHQRLKMVRRRIDKAPGEHAAPAREQRSQASPARQPIGSTTNVMPSTIDPRGYQLPNQYTIVAASACDAAAAHIINRLSQRLQCAMRVSDRARQHTCAIRQARPRPASGSATGRGGSADSESWHAPVIPASCADPRDRYAARLLIRLHHHRQQQRHHHRLDHHIGQHQRLHHRINRQPCRADIRKHRRRAANPIADPSSSIYVELCRTPGRSRNAPGAGW